MGYIAAIGSLVSAGVSLAGDLSKKSPNAGLGAEGGTLQHAASLFVQPFTNSQFWNLDVPGMETQSINYGLSNAGAINTANMQQLQGLLNTALPGYQSGVNAMQRNNMSLLKGNIPTDVQNEIQRFGAQSTLSSGIGGAGGGITGASAGFANTNKTITARDLGLTSLSLQQQGQQQESNLLQLTKNYLTPQQVNPTSLLPLNELVGAQQWMDTSQFNANMAAYTAAAQFASTQAGTPPAPFGGAGGDISGIIAALTKSYGQQGGTGTGSSNSLLGGLFNMFGGSGSGGGGGGASAIGGVSSAGIPGGSVSGFPGE